MLVSILMPVKNAADYLTACLDSILLQTMDSWELIAINDHSEDESWAILRHYAQKDARIKVYNNKEKGIIEALRLAYTHSQGQLITRMDADDLMPPQKLAILSQQLIRTGKGQLATGLVNYFSEKELGQGYQQYADWLNKLTAAGNNFDEIYKECVIPSPCWMLFREDLEACGAFRPNRYPEDYDLCFRFYEQGLNAIPCQEVLHHWRDHAQRSSRTDAHYADNRFIEIKVHYFAKLDHDPQKTLILWGAGKRGKTIAQALIAQKLAFRWVCNNPNKIGHKIYGQLVESTAELPKVKQPQIIISVASPDDQLAIKRKLNKWGLDASKDFFFFC